MPKWRLLVAQKKWVLGEFELFAGNRILDKPRRESKMGSDSIRLQNALRRCASAFRTLIFSAAERVFTAGV